MLFLICQSAPALSVATWVCSFIKAAAIPVSLALFMVADACPCRIYCGYFVGSRLVVSNSNRLRSIFFVCNTTPIREGPFLPVRGLEFLQALLLYMMEGDLLCNQSLMSPMFALTKVFLESVEPTHFLPSLAVSFQLAVLEKVWCLHSLNYTLPLVTGLALIFITKTGCLKEVAPWQLCSRLLVCI